MIKKEFFEINSKKFFLLFITHSEGGGTERQVQELKSAGFKENRGVIIFRQHANITLLEVWGTESEHHYFEFSLETAQKYLTIFLSLFKIKLIHIHHLLGHHGILLNNVITSMNVPLVVTLHDYYFICPRVNLMRKDKKEYCETLSFATCNHCIKNDSSNACNIKSIEMWHKYWGNLLDKANLIIAPSNDTKNRFLKSYPSLNIKVVYHPEIFAKSVNNNKDENNENTNCTIKIGLLGYLPEVKGMNIFYKCIEDIENRKIPAKYILFGKTLLEDNIIKSSYEILGNYEEKNIYKLIASKEIDIFIFLSQVPETYSYVLTIPMLLKLPIIATNLGAFNERLANYPLGKLINWRTNATDINDNILEHVEYCRNINKKFSVPFTTAFPKLEEYYGIKLVDNERIEHTWNYIESLLQKIEQTNQYYYSHPTTSLGMRIYSKSLRAENKIFLGLYWRIRHLFKKYFLE